MESTSLIDAMQQATIIDLEQPRTAEAPYFPAHRPGYLYTLHRRHEPGLGEARSSASGLIVAADHSGTHIDALCHQAESMRICGDVAVTSAIQTPAGFTQAGVETVPPLVGRGILLDVAGPAGDILPPRSLISPGDLEACAERQGVRVEHGDVVLVRTGYGRYWDDATRYQQAAGGSAAASQWLVDRGVRAVGCDNLAWDVFGYTDATTGTTLPGHVLLLVRHGIYIIENLNLEELAARRAYAFLFICVPLKLIGATGSPVRPLALLPV
ncbi:MAG TPA: cyclase family protein [Chloroflexota bacterium]|nr:cyclase family protein [Chloroflexota bacterium]